MRSALYLSLYLCCLLFTSTAFAEESQLELRIARFEQILEAQMTLLRRERLADILKLEERLEALENNPDIADGVAETENDNVGTLAGDIVVRLSALEEDVRTIRGRFDEISFGITQLNEQLERIRKDNEFRFQELERRASTSQVPSAPVSIEPQIIGKIETPTPVDKIELDNKPQNKLSDIIGGEGAKTITLVGEGAPVEVSALPDAQSLTPTSAPTEIKEEPIDVATLYRQALLHLQAQSFAEAERDFQKIIAMFRDHRLAGNAQYWLGETYYTRGDYTQAAAAFLTGYTDFASSTKAPDSLLKLGISLAALAKIEGKGKSANEQIKLACNAFGELAELFPQAQTSILERAALEKGRLGCAS